MAEWRLSVKFCVPWQLVPAQVKTGVGAVRPVKAVVADVPPLVPELALSQPKPVVPFQLAIASVPSVSQECGVAPIAKLAALVATVSVVAAAAARKAKM